MTLLRYFLGAALCAAVQVASAQTFPERPIQLIVGFPPGGGVDIVARQLAETLSDSLGQRVVVENRAGAAGNIAMEYVARAKPDGYTLLMGNLGMLTANPVLYPKLSFDASKDFAPVARVVVTPLLAAIPVNLPAQNVQQLIAMAKAKPNEMSFGSGGNGNINHLAGELLKLLAQVDLQHVPYNGSAPAYRDMLGGRVPVAFVILNSALPHVRAGRLKVLAVTNPKRSQIYPEYPSIGESVAGYELTSWAGFAAPGATPKDIVQKLSTDVLAALQTPEVRQKLTDYGLEVAPQGAQEFDAFIRSETLRLGAIARDTKFKLD